MMDWSAILSAVWAALNSPLGITAAAGLLLWILNRIYAKKPAWEQFEGTIISAVKYAEKEIPDDTPNTSLARFDEALRYVVKIYEQARGKAPSEQELSEIKEGISIIHSDLEAKGAI